MRGSAITQSFKSWASKFHPQLPLSSRESQRLLDALTGSFREQLDGAHPPRAAGGEDARPRPAKAGTEVPVAGKRESHPSSADFAERHMASVLTNPLMTRAEAKTVSKIEAQIGPGSEQHTGEKTEVSKNYQLATAELERNPTKDPIRILEEFQQKGLASMGIARLCLEKVEKSLRNLPLNEQIAAVKQTEPGKRTLLWAWKSGHYNTDAFVEGRLFRKLMVQYAVREGHEELVWEFIKAPVPAGSPYPPGWIRKAEQRCRYPYRWRGYIARDIITAKIASSTKSVANEVMHTYLRATKLAQLPNGDSELDSPDNSVRLAPAASAATAYLRSQQSRLNEVDAAIYDRVIESFWSWSEPTVRRDLEAASLHLKHPRTPNPLPGLNVLKHRFQWLQNKINGKSERKGETTNASDHENEKARRYLYTFMDDVAKLLHAQNRGDDAKWVVGRMHQLFPRDKSSI